MCITKYFSTNYAVDMWQLSYSICFVISSKLESQISMVVQTYTLDYSLFLDANSWTIHSVFPTPGPAVIFLWCSNRQGTALSPEFLATFNPFSLCRTSGKLLAVDHCLFLPVQSVVVEQQESTKSSTGRWEHSCSSYPLDPFLLFASCRESSSYE